MNPILAVVLALWPLWAVLIVLAVVRHVERSLDHAWDDERLHGPRRPGNLSEGRTR